MAKQTTGELENEMKEVAKTNIQFIKNVVDTDLSEREIEIYLTGAAFGVGNLLRALERKGVFGNKKLITKNGKKCTAYHVT